jgi:membrane protein required for colicin V production
LFGAAFGAIRGALSVMLFVLLMHMMIPKESTPAFIANSKLYPYADNAATWLGNTIPGVLEDAKEAIPPLEE